MCHFGKTNITFRGRRREGDGPADGRRAAWQGRPGLTGGRRSGSRERNESELFAEKTPLRGRKEGKKKVGLKSPGQVESGRKRKEEEEEGNLLGTAARTNGGGRRERSAEIGFFLPPSLIPFFFSARHAFRADDLGRFFFAPGRFVDGWLGLAVPPSSLLRY